MSSSAQQGSSATAIRTLREYYPGPQLPNPATELEQRYNDIEDGDTGAVDSFVPAASPVQGLGIPTMTDLKLTPEHLSFRDEGGDFGYRDSLLYWNNGSFSARSLYKDDLQITQKYPNNLTRQQVMSAVDDVISDTPNHQVFQLPNGNLIFRQSIFTDACNPSDKNDSYLMSENLARAVAIATGHKDDAAFCRVKESGSADSKMLRLQTPISLDEILTAFEIIAACQKAPKTAGPEFAAVCATVDASEMTAFQDKITSDAEAPWYEKLGGALGGFIASSIGLKYAAWMFELQHDIPATLKKSVQRTINIGRYSKQIATRISAYFQGKSEVASRPRMTGPEVIDMNPSSTEPNTPTGKGSYLGVAGAVFFAGANILYEEGYISKSMITRINFVGGLVLIGAAYASTTAAAVGVGGYIAGEEATESAVLALDPENQHVKSFGIAGGTATAAAAVAVAKRVAPQLMSWGIRSIVPAGRYAAPVLGAGIVGGVLGYVWQSGVNSTSLALSGHPWVDAYFWDDTAEWAHNNLPDVLGF